VSTVFSMPSLGADMTDGVITEWLVAPGDEVTRGQIVVIVETDKSDIEVEIFEAGVIDELIVPEGERVAVGTPIARLRAVDGEPSPETGAGEATAPELTAGDDMVPDATTPDAPHPVTAAAIPGVSGPGVSGPGVSGPGVSGPGVSGITSPLVRHLAEELHVDMAVVHGSGPGGRVHRDDVLAASRHADTVPVTPRARILAAQFDVDLHQVKPAGAVITGDDVLAHSSAPGASTTTPTPAPARNVASAQPAAVDPKRRAIASLMTTSWSEIPHYHVGTRIDVGDPLARLREVNEHRPVTERILPAALLLYAVARAARAVPQLNGWWVDGAFVQAESVDLGVVVSLRGGGIIVPTITRADERSADDIMVQLAGLVGRARANKLRSSDVSRASLTVTNLGDLGAEVVYGVIHPPQVALVGLGAIHDEPWAHDGMVGVRPVVHATLSGDHRAADGLVGATFLSKFNAALRNVDLPDPQEQP
jgi:pyruvate dehydrogenase E2 component (dihydrolipoamide acetyltransferase)